MIPIVHYALQYEQLFFYIHRHSQLQSLVVPKKVQVTCIISRFMLERVKRVKELGPV